MCLLIAKKAGVPLPDNFEEICKEADECNSDGMGFATCGGLFKKKGISASQFAKVVRENVEVHEPAIFHWRMSTSGYRNDENCHPFKLPDGGFFAHNGTISYKYKPENGLSDTATLAQSVFTTQQLYYKCQELVSASNKFAIITPKNELHIIGENHGTWDKDGLWYSNMYWKGGKNRWYYNNQYDCDYYEQVSRSKPLLRDELAKLVCTYGLSRVVEELDTYMAGWRLD